MKCKVVDGQTRTRCDGCGKFNISLNSLTSTSVVTIDTFLGKKTSYLLCTECSNKFTKLMEDFVNAQN